MFIDTFEFYYTLNGGKKRIITTPEDVAARMEDRTALADQN